MKSDMDELDVDEYAQRIRDNLVEGKFGTRGEAWVAGQALAVGCVMAAPELPGVPVLSITLGVLSILLGCALCATAAYDLGTNLTPWPKPVEASDLKTDGAYSLCRHPIYAGLVLFCFGAGLATCSFERLLFALGTFALLSLKASREEEFLIDKHGVLYEAYSADVPQLIPSPFKLQELLLELARTANR
jgi:protein-S-isoprenylcysteine O-methyltransferase Ste14